MQSRLAACRGADFEFGDAGLGLGKGAPRLADVEFTRGTGLKSSFDDRQGLTLQLDVEAGVIDLLLERRNCT